MGEKATLDDASGVPHTVAGPRASDWAKAGHPVHPVGKTRTPGGATPNDANVEDEAGNLWHVYMDGGDWHYQWTGTTGTATDQPIE